MYTKPKQSFTLMELLIVIAIIGLLAAAVIFGVKTAVDKSRQSRTMEDVKAITQAVKAYYLDNGSYPTTSWGWRCLGDTNGDGACWLNNYFTDPALDSKLSPYLPSVPSPSYNDPSCKAYDGYLYVHSRTVQAGSPNAGKTGPCLIWSDPSVGSQAEMQAKCAGNAYYWDDDPCHAYCADYLGH